MSFGNYFRKIFTVDLRALAVLRILTALLFLYDLYDRSTALAAHYTNEGVLPLGPWQKFKAWWHFSLLAIDGSSGFAAVFFGLGAVWGLALLVGYRSRLAAVLSWLWLISVQDRNLLLVTGGDTVFKIVLFWLIFLPADRFYALDSRHKPVTNTAYYSWVGIALFIQLVAVYLFAALLKTGEVWHNGQAVYYAMSLEYYTKPLAKWLLGYPKFMVFLSYFTYYLEALGWLLLFIGPRNAWWRLLAYVLFAGMHLSFFATMHLGIFPAACVVFWTFVLPPEFWDKFATARPSAISVVTPKWLNMLAIITTAHILLWNLASLKVWQLPDLLRAYTRIVHLDQEWNMFAPVPSVEDGWFVVAAQLKNGREIDLFNNTAQPDFNKPAYIPDAFGNHRWRKYLRQLYMRKFKKYRTGYARYLLKNYNAAQGNTPDAAVTLYICYMLETTPPMGQTPHVQKRIIWYHWTAQQYKDQILAKVKQINQAASEGGKEENM